MTETSISSVPLVEVLDALRQDLKTAQEHSNPEAPLIIKEIEVELQVVVNKSTAADAKAKLEVLNVAKLLGLGSIEGELKLNGAWATASTQKIKLKLLAAVRDPETDKLGNMHISDESTIR